MKEMKKMIFACMSAFLLVGSMFIMPLNTVSASTSDEYKDNLGGTWKVDVDVNKKSNGACTLKVNLSHNHTRSVRKAIVHFRFKNGSTQKRTVAGMIGPGKNEQLTFYDKPVYCGMDGIAITNVKLN